MTSTTPNPAHVAAAPPAYQLPQRVTQARVLRSEWTKLRTQPSVFWSLLATIILIAGFGILYSLVRETRPPHGAAAIASFDPAGVSLSGVQLAQIGAAAATAGITVLELATEQTSLEDAFVDMTQDAVEFRAAPRPAAVPTFEEEK